MKEDLRDVKDMEKCQAATQAQPMPSDQNPTICCPILASMQCPFMYGYGMPPQPQAVSAISPSYVMSQPTMMPSFMPPPTMAPSMMPPPPPMTTGMMPPPSGCPGTTPPSGMPQSLMSGVGGVSPYISYPYMQNPPMGINY